MSRGLFRRWKKLRLFAVLPMYFYRKFTAIESIYTVEYELTIDVCMCLVVEGSVSLYCSLASINSIETIMCLADVAHPIVPCLCLRLNYGNRNFVAKKQNVLIAYCFDRTRCGLFSWFDMPITASMRYDPRNQKLWWCVIVNILLIAKYFRDGIWISDVLMV